MDIMQSILQKYLGGAVTNKIAKATGLSEGQIASLVSKVLPLFSGAVAKNVRTNDTEKESFFNAVRDDHDGSVFEHLDDVIRDPKSLKGDKILKHVFGDNEDGVEEELAKEVGTSKEQSQSVMQMLAPLAMGALGKEQSDNNLGLDDVMGMLGSGDGDDGNLLSKGMDMLKRF